MDGPCKKIFVVLSYIFLPPHTVNMTVSPLLLANGHPFECSDYVISQCPLCPVKLSTEFCIGSGGGGGISSAIMYMIIVV